MRFKLDHLIVDARTLALFVTCPTKKSNWTVVDEVIIVYHLSVSSSNIVILMNWRFWTLASTSRLSSIRKWTSYELRNRTFLWNFLEMFFPKKGVPLWLHLFPGVESFWKQGKEIGIQGGFKREDDWKVIVCWIQTIVAAGDWTK